MDIPSVDVSTATNDGASSRAKGHRSAAPGRRKISDAVYQAELFRLQTEFVKLQEWARHSGARLVVIFEGRDGAGKGGAIKRITSTSTREWLVSRHCPRRRIASGVSGTTSVILPIFPPKVR